MNINTNYSQLKGGYYSLAQTSSHVVSTSPVTAAKAVTSSSAANENLSAYLLDLSPQARDYLNHGAVGTISSSFTLSQAQQSSIDAILQKYKDQPYTQDTFNQIQNDLRAAGLSPDQLAAQQQVKDFNTTQTLLDALSGKKPRNQGENALGVRKDDDRQYDAQKQNFVQSLIDQFKKIAAPVL